MKPLWGHMRVYELFQSVVCNIPSPLRENDKMATTYSEEL